MVLLLDGTFPYQSLLCLNMVKSEVVVDHCYPLVLRSGQRVQPSLIVLNQPIRATAISASGGWFDHSFVGTTLQMGAFIATSVVVQDVA